MYTEYSQKTENTFSVKYINVSSVFFTIAFMIVSSIIYIIMWNGLPLKDYFVTPSLKPFIRMMVFIIVMVFGFGIHEVLHGIGFNFFGKVPWNMIEIGVKWRVLTPYAHCSVPLKLNQYKKALLLPCVVLGIIPFIIGLVTEQFLLYFGGMLFIVAAYGDLFVVWSLRKTSSKAYVEDHPEKLGCYILGK